MKHNILQYRVIGFIVLAVLLIVQESPAAPLFGRELVRTLRQGGKVVVMRHASSPHIAPTRETAAPGNSNLERQLDENGRTTAIAMGNAIRRLNIPVGRVLSSPTYRALETVTMAKLPTPKVYEELGNAGHGMRAVSGDESEWLKRQVMHWPEDKNTVIVTHSPNIKAAFPRFGRHLTDGEALILGEDGKGGIALLTRIKIEEWPTLAGD